MILNIAGRRESPHTIAASPSDGPRAQAHCVGFPPRLLSRRLRLFWHARANHTRTNEAAVPGTSPP
jgi:hypothetical protein